MQLLAIAMERDDFQPDDILQMTMCARKGRFGQLCNEIVYIRVRHWTLIEH